MKKKGILILGILIGLIIVMSGGVFGEAPCWQNYDEGTWDYDGCATCGTNYLGELDDGPGHFCSSAELDSDQSGCENSYYYSNIIGANMSCKFNTDDDKTTCNDGLACSPPACFTAGTKVIVLKDVDELTPENELVVFNDNKKWYNLVWDKVRSFIGSID